MYRKKQVKELLDNYITSVLLKDVDYHCKSDKYALVTAIELYLQVDSDTHNVLSDKSCVFSIDGKYKFFKTQGFIAKKFDENSNFSVWGNFIKEHYRVLFDKLHYALNKGKFFFSDDFSRSDLRLDGEEKSFNINTNNIYARKMYAGEVQRMLIGKMAFNGTVEEEVY